jgi:hypothetical protein
MTDRENEADEPQDTFDQFKDLAVEQLANAAQLVAEARRLGLVPELPRELAEKMDLGGTVMDLLRLHLKHATAISQVLGSNGRNMEKLNYLSAVLAKGKSHAPQVLRSKRLPDTKVARFEITLDNPVDRPQRVDLTLGKLYCLTDERTFELNVHPNDGIDVTDWKFADHALFRIVPKVLRLEEREVRTFRVLIGVPETGEFEVTATAKLAPLGTYNRYQLRILNGE